MEMVIMVTFIAFCMVTKSETVDGRSLIIVINNSLMV